MHALTVVVSGPKFTNFYFFCRKRDVGLVDNDFFRWSISRSISEIFEDKV